MLTSLSLIPNWRASTRSFTSAHLETFEMNFWCWGTPAPAGCSKWKKRRFEKDSPQKNVKETLGGGQAKGKTCFAFLALILYLCRNFLLFLVMESHDSAQVQHGGKQAHVMIDDFAQQFQIRVSAIKPTKCQRHLKAARKAKSTNLSTQTYRKCHRSPRKESNSWHSKTMQSHMKRETPGNISLNLNEGQGFAFFLSVMALICEMSSWELTYPIPRHVWRWLSFSQGGIC